jgi:hypothetical protein
MPPLRSSFAEQKATGGSRFPAPEKPLMESVTDVKIYDFESKLDHIDIKSRFEDAFFSLRNL